MAPRFRAFRVWTACIVPALLGLTTCQKLAAPTPPSPPSPSIPNALPNATALQNLPMIRNLEQATGRHSILVQMSAPAVDTSSGAASPGNGWHYEFAEERPGGVHYHDWRVQPDGRVFPLFDITEVHRLDLREIEPFISIDSREAAQLGLQNGGQRYLDRFPQGYLEMTCRFIANEVVWDMKFATITIPGTCAVPIVIAAATGQLLYRDVSCLDR